jgi:hypothetical protein
MLNMLINVYKIYIQGPCQSMLSIADYALFLVAFATTAVFLLQLLVSRYIDSVRTTRCLAMDIFVNPHRKHLLRHWFYCCVRVLRPLPRNGSTLLLVAYLLRACLPRRSLAMGLYVTILKLNLKK